MAGPIISGVQGSSDPNQYAAGVMANQTSEKLHSMVTANPSLAQNPVFAYALSQHPDISGQQAGNISHFVDTAATIQQHAQDNYQHHGAWQDAFHWVAHNFDGARHSVSGSFADTRHSVAALDNIGNDLKGVKQLAVGATHVADAIGRLPETIAKDPLGFAKGFVGGVGEALTGVGHTIYRTTNTAIEVATFGAVGVDGDGNIRLANPLNDSSNLDDAFGTVGHLATGLLNSFSLMSHVGAYYQSMQKRYGTSYTTGHIAPSIIAMFLTGGATGAVEAGTVSAEITAEAGAEAAIAAEAVTVAERAAAAMRENIASATAGDRVAGMPGTRMLKPPRTLLWSGRNVSDFDHLASGEAHDVINKYATEQGWTRSGGKWVKADGERPSIAEAKALREAAIKGYDERYITYRNAHGVGPLSPAFADVARDFASTPIKTFDEIQKGAPAYAKSLDPKMLTNIGLEVSPGTVLKGMELGKYALKRLGELPKKTDVHILDNLRSIVRKVNEEIPIEGTKLRTNAELLTNRLTKPFTVASKIAHAAGKPMTDVKLNVMYAITQQQALANKDTQALWEATRNGDVVDRHGKIIGTNGQMLAKYLELSKDNPFYAPISGLTDFYMNWMGADPMGAVGKVVGRARSAEGFTGHLNLWWGGLGVKTGQDIYRTAAQYPNVMKAYLFIATHGAGDIGRRFPNTFSSELIRELDKIHLKYKDPAQGVDAVMSKMAEMADGRHFLQGNVPVMNTRAVLAARLRDSNLLLGNVLESDRMVIDSLVDVAKKGVKLDIHIDSSVYGLTHDVELRARTVFRRWLHTRETSDFKRFVNITGQKIIDRAGQNPMYLDGGKWESHRIKMGDDNAIPALMNWMAKAHLPESLIKATGDALYRSKDGAEWATTVIEVMTHVVARKAISGLDHSILDTIAVAATDDIRAQVRELVGRDGGGGPGIYVAGKDGMDDSMLLGEGETVPEMDGIGTTHLGEFHFPDPRQLEGLARHARKNILAIADGSESIIADVRSLTEAQTFAFANFRGATLKGLIPALNNVHIGNVDDLTIHPWNNETGRIMHLTKEMAKKWETVGGTEITHEWMPVDHFLHDLWELEGVGGNEIINEWELEEAVGETSFENGFKTPLTIDFSSIGDFAVLHPEDAKVLEEAVDAGVTHVPVRLRELGYVHRRDMPNGSLDVPIPMHSAGGRDDGLYLPSELNLPTFGYQRKGVGYIEQGMQRFYENGGTLINANDAQRTAAENELFVDKITNKIEELRKSGKELIDLTNLGWQVDDLRRELAMQWYEIKPGEPQSEGNRLPSPKDWPSDKELGLPSRVEKMMRDAGLLRGPFNYESALQFVEETVKEAGQKLIRNKSLHEALRGLLNGEEGAVAVDKSGNVVGAIDYLSLHGYTRIGFVGAEGKQGAGLALEHHVAKEAAKKNHHIESEIGYNSERFHRLMGRDINGEYSSWSESMVRAIAQLTEKATPPVKVVSESEQHAALSYERTVEQIKARVHQLGEDPLVHDAVGFATMAQEIKQRDFAIKKEMNELQHRMLTAHLDSESSHYWESGDPTDWVVPKSILDEKRVAILEGEHKAINEALNHFNAILAETPFTEKAILERAKRFAEDKGILEENMDTFADEFRERILAANRAKYGYLSRHQRYADMVNRYLSATFVPLALLSGGWAFRVATSEAMLNSLRIGGWGFVDAKLAASIAKHELRGRELRQTVITNASSREYQLSKRISDKPKEFTIPLTNRTVTISEKAVIRAHILNAIDSLHMGVNDIFAGAAMGVEKNLLNGIGREEAERMVDNFVSVMMRHDGHLPMGVHQTESVVANELSDSLDDLHYGIGDDGGRTIGRAARAKEFELSTLHSSGYVTALWENLFRIQRDDLMFPVTGKLREILGKTTRYPLDTAEKTLLPLLRKEALKVIEDMNPADRARFKRDTMKSYRSSPETTAHEDWANVLAKHVINSFKGRGATEDIFHVNLMDQVLKMDLKEPRNLYYDVKAMNNGFEAPDHIPTRKFVEINWRQKLLDTKLINRISDVGHDKILGPIVNSLVRDPLFLFEYHKAMEEIAPMVKNNIIDLDQAEVLADQRAIIRMSKYVHNPKDKMVFEANARMVAPFYFAKNQAWRRAFRVMQEDPGAFEKYMRSCLLVTDWMSKGATQTNNNSVVMPMSAFMGNIGASANILGGFLPGGSTPDANFRHLSFGVSLSAGSVDSMIVTGSEGGWSAVGGFIRPPWGPAVTVPIKLLERAIGNHTGGQAVDKYLQAFLGPISSNTSIFSDLVPNTFARNIYAMIRQNGGFAAVQVVAMNNAWDNLVQSKYEAVMKKYPGPWAKPGGGVYSRVDQDAMAMSIANEDATASLKTPQAKQRFIDNARAAAYMMFAAKTLLSFSSPLTVSVQKEFSKEPEFQKLMDEKKLNGKLKYTYVTAVQEFTKLYPEKVFDIVSHSKSPYNSYPETKEVVDFLKNNRALVQKYPAACAMLVSQTGTYDPKAYALEVSMGLRVLDTPQEYLDQLLVQAGNEWYNREIIPFYPHTVEKDGVTVDLAKKAVRERNGAALTYGMNDNPTWYAYHGGDVTMAKAAQSVDQMKAMLKDESVTVWGNGQKERLLQLMDMYDTQIQHYETEIKSGHSSQAGRILKNWSSYCKSDAAKQYWSDSSHFLTNIVAKLPNR